MFLEFQKISTSHPSHKTGIIVNSHSILTIDSDVFENLETRSQYEAVRIDLVGFPKYSFHIEGTMDSILAKIPFKIDVTNGFVPGKNCEGGTSIGIVTPTETYPLVKALRIFNNTLTESDPFAFNPRYIVYSEEFSFNDARLKTESKGMMLVLHESSLSKVSVNMTYDTMKKLLNPISV